MQIYYCKSVKCLSASEILQRLSASEIFLKRLSASEIFQDLRHLNSLKNEKTTFLFTECEQNVCEIFLFLISLFFKDVPQSLSLDRFLFCCCDDSTGLARCLQDFANVCENVRMG